MKNIAIVIVAYNREKSLKRLLESLRVASYYDYNVTLIISVDKSKNPKVLSVAEEFEWENGEKKVIEHEVNLGLRKHVLYCGNLSKNYDAIIMLEDDLIVSPYFFNYSIQSIEKYIFEENVAGISLYTHLWNVVVDRPFLPINNGFDAYFFKFAQSWGQIWTKDMWEKFYVWYENEKYTHGQIDLPKNVINWPESSWLKYFIWYLVDQNKYFVYPYVSLTSNFTDAGTHNKVKNNSFQVPLMMGEVINYNLPDFSKEALRYDVYFEIENLGGFLGVNDSELCIDIYGNKQNYENKRYWLSSRILPYLILKKYDLCLRPHELNVIFNLEGNDFFLYDTEILNSENRKPKDLIELSKIKYDIRNISLKKLLKISLFELKMKFKRSK